MFFCVCLRFLPSLSYSSWLTGCKKPKQVTYIVLWHLHINLWRCIGSGYVMLWWFRLVIIMHNQTDVWCVNVCVWVCIIMRNIDGRWSLVLDLYWNDWMPVAWMVLGFEGLVVQIWTIIKLCRTFFWCSYFLFVHLRGFSVCSKKCE